MNKDVYIILSNYITLYNTTNKIYNFIHHCVVENNKKANDEKHT